MVENFKQALREVFVSDKEKENEEKRRAEMNQEGNHAPAEENKNQEQKESGTSQKAQKNQRSIKGMMNPVVANVFMEAKNATITSRATNVITKDTRIVGTITTDSKLEIAGEVEGDITSNNIVTVTGAVHGDIKCISAEIDNAQIEGNIEVSDKLQIKSKSKIVGDLSGTDIEISGHVKGNIDASQSVKLHADACVEGNITSASISIETGAVLQGNVSIQREEAQAS
ncbi:MAG: bactofilin family protein [Clostridia bacterium]|jgi:cytoskeletal protein CcmA (bactofilin family)